MRYLIAGVVACIVALVAAVVFVFMSLPSGPGAFGIAKLVPLLTVTWTGVFFCFLWLPATLIAFATDRPRKFSEAVLPLLVSVVVLLAAGNWLRTNQRAKAEYRRITVMSSEATAATNHFEKFQQFVDVYTKTNPRSIYPQKGYYRVVAALVRNPATPPEILERLSDGLEIQHEFQTEIATHPNCPARVIERFQGIPRLEVFLAKNPRASPKLLDQLSRSASPDVRASIVWHPSASTSILERLAADPDWLVRRAMTNRIERERISKHLMEHP